MTELENAIKLARALDHIDTLEKDVRELTTSLAAMRVITANAERNQLKWGVSALGLVVMTLGGIIWQFRGVIFK